MNIMIEISTYIFIAIVLGYFFGWLITKLLLKERYQSQLDEMLVDNKTETEEINKIKDELVQVKKDNKRLKTQNKELNSGYDGQKYVLEEHNEVLDDFQKRLHSKDEIIEVLTSNLSLAEEKQMKIEKKYEEEIDAFMFERIDITQKYKNLLEKFNLLKQHKGMLQDKDSWFSKFFSSPSPAH
jgi:uncharacterized protein YeeX (DUF496 family)